MKERKNNNFISKLMDEALKCCFGELELLRKKGGLEETDPQRIMPVLADVPSPQTAKLLHKRIFRM